MLPENFFDEQEYITNVTAIVGENGAGKTTILDMLSNYQGSVKDKEYDPIYDNYFREKYECLWYLKMSMIWFYLRPSIDHFTVHIVLEYPYLD